jgi:hypothetical protein
MMEQSKIVGCQLEKANCEFRDRTRDLGRSERQNYRRSSSRNAMEKRGGVFNQKESREMWQCAGVLDLRL